jgi:hypothetical protein
MYVYKDHTKIQGAEPLGLPRSSEEIEYSRTWISLYIIKIRLLSYEFYFKRIPVPGNPESTIT